MLLRSCFSPRSKVSRYLYGIRFKTRDVPPSAYEASGSKLGVTVDKHSGCSVFTMIPPARSYVLFRTQSDGGAGEFLTVFILVQFFSVCGAANVTCTFQTIW